MLEPVNLVNHIARLVTGMDDTVCILGQGALGLLATQLARIYGAKAIIVSDPLPLKREMSGKFGADIVLDPTKVNVVHEIERITDGRGVNALFECAGEPSTIQKIPYIAGFRCKVACIGACCHPVSLDWSYIHFKGMTVVSTSTAVLGDIPGALKKTMAMMDSHRLNLLPMITHRYKLEEIERAFEDVASGQVIKGVFELD